MKLFVSLFVTFAISSSTFVNAQTSNTTITAISPTSVTTNTATSIILTGTVAANDLLIWATDCSNAIPNVDPNDGTNKATVYTVTGLYNYGWYKLCYRKAGESDSVEQTGIKLTVVAATAANTITAISPAEITSASATSITLTGTVAANDLLIWAPNCSSAIPNVDPTDGTNKSTSYTVTGAGTYKLCYRKAGGSDSVEQTGITLTVVAATKKTDSSKKDALSMGVQSLPSLLSFVIAFCAIILFI